MRGKSVNGKALILFKDSSYSLAQENISSANGSDIDLKRSRQTDPNNIIDLGRLKSTNGNQVYSLASTDNINEHR